jgi:hypothetical protein
MVTGRETLLVIHNIPEERTVGNRIRAGRVVRDSRPARVRIGRKSPLQDPLG